MSRVYDYAPSDKGLARAAIAVTVIVTALAIFFYMTKSPAARKFAAPAAAGKSNAFSGHYGYLMTYPAGYEVYPEMRGATEMVFFYPKGTKLTTDEKQYKALGIIRLEVVPRMQIQGRSVTSEELKMGVLATLEKNGETYTSKNLTLDKPAFQVNITAPNPIIQVFVEGAKVQYAFTGGDELPLQALAENIMEVDTAAAPEASGPEAETTPGVEEESVGKQIDGGFIAYGGTYLPIPKGYTAGSLFAPADQEIERVYIYPDNMKFADAQKHSYATNSSMMILEIIPDAYTTREDLLEFALGQGSVYKKQKWKYTSRWLKNSKIPTLMVDITDPKHIDVFRFTSKTTYKFVAAEWTTTLQSIMAGLKDPEPAR